MIFHVNMGGGGFPFPPPPNCNHRITHFDWIVSREIPVTETILVSGQDGLTYYTEEQFSAVETVSATESINIEEKDKDSL